MTDIDSMTGPELRQAVAIEVMGWVDILVMASHFWTHPDGVYSPECPRVEDWKPDTDWAAFGMVVERVPMALIPPVYAGQNWVARWALNPVAEWALYQATGETPMLAGCRVALKAVRAK